MRLEIEELKAIRERVSKLEKQNRRLQRGMIAMLAALTGFLAMGQAPAEPKIVEAQKFVLKDRDGSIRGWVGSVGKGSEIVLGNDQAQPMITLRVSTDAGDLHFYGNRRSGMNLGMNSGIPSIAILDGDSHGQVEIGFENHGPSLRLEDSNGFRAIVGTAPAEYAPSGPSRIMPAASVILSDKNKKVLWKAP